LRRICHSTLENHSCHLSQGQNNSLERTPMKKISAAKSAPARPPAREWSRRDASDIDGQAEGRNERERMSQNFRSSVGEGGFFNPRALIGVFCFAVLLVAPFAFGAPPRSFPAQGPEVVKNRSFVSLDNPATQTWIVTGSLNTARDEHTATLLPNGKVLVAGGIDIGSTNTATAELYDPASKSWTATGSLNDERSYFTTTLLPDGKVLVAGGDSKEGERTSAELYDPASGTWTFTGSLHVARQLHTATLLPDGKVLVAGGYNAIDQIIDSVELYDPATGNWTIINSLNVARFSHTATLLPNGTCLSQGGLVAAALWQARNCMIRRTEVGLSRGISIQRASYTERRCCLMAKCLLTEGSIVTAFPQARNSTIR